MEAHAALVGAARIVMLDAEAGEDLQRAIVHAHRDAEGELPQRPAQNFADLRVQFEQSGHPVKLLLRHFEFIYTCHDFSPFRIENVFRLKPCREGWGSPPSPRFNETDESEAKR
ncbi:MAG: hypothetical protein ABSA01_13090 [Anaerolineales bacterium]